MKRAKMKTVMLAGVMVVALAGCIHDDDDNDGLSQRAFSITVTNLTSNQPLSPLALVFHDTGYGGVTPGAAASAALEKLAEGGDNADFLAEADSHARVGASAAGSGIIAPGGSEAVMVSGVPRDRTLLTLVTMLVNTNDAIAALDGVQLGALDENESLALQVLAYDAGTEANSEAMADIPGPAAGGEGYNAQRDDRDLIVVHPGVISAGDGLATSVLDGTHRFDNPVARVVVTRTR